MRKTSTTLKVFALLLLSRPHMGLAGQGGQYIQDGDTITVLTERPATRIVFDDLWEQIEARDKTKPGDNK